jgi:PIN domain nuclease of toxin-antitoxin system
VILLDTHIWIWWVQGDPRLPPSMDSYLDANEKWGLGVSVISCLEVARLAIKGRITLPLPVAQWVRDALAYPHVKLFELTPEIAVESTTLPGSFHKDPQDRIIVATARHHNIPLMTVDQDIRAYPDVQLVE